MIFTIRCSSHHQMKQAQEIKIETEKQLVDSDPIRHQSVRFQSMILIRYVVDQNRINCAWIKAIYKPKTTEQEQNRSTPIHYNSYEDYDNDERIETATLKQTVIAEGRIDLLTCLLPWLRDWGSIPFAFSEMLSSRFAVGFCFSQNENQREKQRALIKWERE